MGRITYEAYMKIMHVSHQPWILLRLEIQEQWERVGAEIARRMGANAAPKAEARSTPGTPARWPDGGR